ncbi:LysM peptidoglycan-binding domain-containing protein [Verticiella sediminum]|uniref:LysM peptidoglycan-binding domain-containing protein n=1 Tax=Verticiella sediminum TaxID=1247510 RepID=A0A556AII8_9BURK|nr:FecR domain-containing protein [Verticiella sediminum]TSH92724.1 LysM peptidoglycan-binding domain-containing protein [Verticiella sediminum]
MNLLHLKRLAGVLALSHAAALSWAAQPIQHVVVAGDTLYDLAERYLDDPAQWQALALANGNPQPTRLPPGLVIVVPAELLRARPGGARIEHLSGDVTLQAAGQAPRPLAPDDVVLDGDVLVTARNGFATLRLADGSLVRVAGDSEVRFDRLGYSVRRKRGDTRVGLTRGRVESSVPRRTAGPANRFEVQTPVMSTGVRGTRFGVSMGPAGAAADVSEGRVAAQARSAGAVAVRAGMGLSSQAPAAPVRLLAAPDLGGVPVLQERPLIDVAFPAVPGALAYRAYLTRDTALDQVVANDVFATPRARLEGLEDGHYLVAIRAIDAHGIEGAVASVPIDLRARPEPPATLAPDVGGEVASADVELRWAAVTQAASYDLEVARNIDFAQPLVQQRVTGTAHALAALATGQYYWRIRSVPAEGAPPGRPGPYSDPRAFSVRPPVATRVEVQQSADRLALHWDGEPGQTYRVQVAGDPQFAAPQIDLTTDAPRLDAPALDGGRYYLRVQATDPDGYVRRYSTPQAFDVRRLVRVGAGALRVDGGAGVELP